MATQQILSCMPSVSKTIGISQAAHVTANDYIDDAIRKVVEKHPDRQAVIVDTTKITEKKELKLLVPLDMTVGSMTYVIRKRIQLDPSEALFLMCGTIMAPTSALVATLPKDESGATHVRALKENTFG